MSLWSGQFSTEAVRSMADSVAKITSQMLTPTVHGAACSSGDVTVTDTVSIAPVPAESETTVSFFVPASGSSASVSSDTVSVNLSFKLSNYKISCAILKPLRIFPLRDLP